MLLSFWHFCFVIFVVVDSELENNFRYSFIVLFQLFMKFIDENTQFYKLLYKHSKNIYVTVIVFAWVVCGAPTLFNLQRNNVACITEPLVLF